MNLVKKTLDQVLEFKAPPQAQVTTITRLIKTPGSDRLTSYSMACGDWTVIASNEEQTETDFGRPRYKVGDICIYVALDSCLSEPLYNYLFPKGSKITLDNNRRIKILKLRGAYSYGMIIDINDELLELYPKLKDLKLREGEDVAGILGIKKYEPPVSSMSSNMKGKESKKHPLFHEYDLKHLKWFGHVFEEGELVSVTEKIHGTHWRGGYLPTIANTWWKKVLKFFNLLPKYSWVYGSRRVQLQDKSPNHKGYYSDNVYRIAAEQNKMKEKLKPGEVLYAELISQGIQKNYSYNLKEGQYKLLAFDVEVDGKFYSPALFREFCKQRDIETVPFLGEMPYNLERLTELASAKVGYNGQKIREGVVIKKLQEQSHPACGRVALKLISPLFLMRDDVEDWH